MQKRNELCRFDKVMLEGHIHLTAFKTFFLVNKAQRRLLDMTEMDFENGPNLCKIPFHIKNSSPLRNLLYFN